MLKRKVKVMNQMNSEIGKLLWERQLFEQIGNYLAAARIDKLIQRIREGSKRKNKDDEGRKS